MRRSVRHRKVHPSTCKDQQAQRTSMCVAMATVRYPSSTRFPPSAFMFAHRAVSVPLRYRYRHTARGATTPPRLPQPWRATSTNRLTELALPVQPIRICARRYDLPHCKLLTRRHDRLSAASDQHENDPPTSHPRDLTLTCGGARCRRPTAAPAPPLGAPTTLPQRHQRGAPPQCTPSRRRSRKTTARLREAIIVPAGLEHELAAARPAARTSD